DIAHLLQAASRLCSAHPEETRKLLPTATLVRRIGSRVIACAQHTETTPDETQRWLEALVNVMPGSEHLWQALIRHYIRQGMATDALDAWDRCKESLQLHCGMQPSEITRALLQPSRQHTG